MRKMSPLSIVVLVSLAMVLGVAPGERRARAKESTANDCLIAVQDKDGNATSGKVTTLSCKDGAACDSDGATNGSCTIKIQACTKLAGCESRTIKPGSAKVKPKKLGVEVLDSGCGAFTDLVLPLKGKKHNKKRSKVVRALAAGSEKPTGKNKDTDKLKVTCEPCDTDNCVPAVCGDGIVGPGETCDTAATPNGCPDATPICNACTSCSAPVCGNGVIEPGETCDPDAAPNGCSGGTPFCDPQTCTSCKASCTQIAFTTGTPTTYCGFPGQGAGPVPPLSGEIDSDPTGACVANVCGNGSLGTDGAGACAQDADCTKLYDLGLGCLYIGGGLAAVVPPGPTPDHGTTILGVSDCSQTSVSIQPDAGTGPKTCSLAPKSTLKCANGHPGTDGNGACAQDSDCAPTCVNGSCVDGSPGSDGNGACTQQMTGSNNCGPSSLLGPPKNVCINEPSCFFGAPLPFDNGGTSTCVLNVIDSGLAGTVDVSTGAGNITLPLKSWVYLTGLEPEFTQGQPCPICDNGTCSGGQNKGQACTTENALKTSQDCPPSDYLFLAPLGVTLGPLTTGAATFASPTGVCGTTGCDMGVPNCCTGNEHHVCSVDSDCDGLFCTDQGTPGAFGVGGARSFAENGSATGPLSVSPSDTTLASTFCIPATNSPLVDASADLPGPGATGLSGSLRLR